MYCSICYIPYGFHLLNVDKMFRLIIKKISFSSSYYNEIRVIGGIQRYFEQ